MSLFRRPAAIQERTSWPPQVLVPGRGGGAIAGGIVPVSPETARMHSAVWACLRLRADLVSTMPVGVFRTIDGINVRMTTPNVLKMPGGERCDINEWLYSSQIDLDSVGNSIGIITKVDGYGLPACVELQDRSTCSVIVKSGKLTGYRIAGKKYEPDAIWHEKQHTMSGLHVGLSPVAYAAMSISTYVSAQQFALQWFGDGAIPAAMLRNTAKTLTATEAALAKRQFKATVAARDVLVTGADWEYKMIQADESTTTFLATMRAGVLEICRFLGVPSDMIDGESENKGTIKYTNITQRNLELLILNLQPALVRRETALSRMTPAGRQALFATSSLLRMDPAVLASVMLTRINSRTLTVDEARAEYNLPPLTEEQYAQFDRLFPSGAQAGLGTTALTGVEPPA